MEYAIRNKQTGVLIVDEQSGIFDSRADAQAEMAKFAELDPSATTRYEVVDFAEAMDVQPDPLSDFEMQVAQTIGKRFA